MALTQKQYISYIKSSIDMWKKSLVPKMKVIYSEQAITVIDVGAGCGAALIAMAELGLIKEAYLIEPRFKKWKKMLSSLGYDSNFFKKHNIHILVEDGLFEQIPYDSADLIIKTFNPWTPWSNIVSRVSHNCLLLSSMAPDTFLRESPDYIQIKRAHADSNSYEFFRKKTK